MSRVSNYWLIIGILLVVVLPPVYADPQVYLNDTAQYFLKLTSKTKNYTLSSNVTQNNTNINSTFEFADDNEQDDPYTFDVSYVSGNATGYLIKLRLINGVSTSDSIEKFDCVNPTSFSTICDSSCVGINFDKFHNFTIIFNGSNLMASASIDGVNKFQTDICTNATMIDKINFSWQQGNVAIKNNLLTATPSSTPDTTPPVVNATLNKSLIISGDVLNLTANATDNAGLSFGQIVENSTGFSRFYNFSLSGAADTFSQNISVNCSPCVINFTARVNDTSNNFRTNDTIISVLDTTPPIINGTLNSTSGYSNIKINDLLNITFNITDETGLSYANITWNFSSNNLKINFTGLSGTSAQINNVTKLSDYNVIGGNVINVTGYATDSSGNAKQNSTLFTVVDNIFPMVNSSFNMTNPNINDIINVTGNITDETGLLSANITYNFSVGKVFVNFSFSDSRTIANISNATQLIGVGSSVVNVTIYATDTSNNVKQNSTIFIIVDNINPFVNTAFNTTSPSNTDLLNFTGNATDETAILTANWTINFTTGKQFFNYSYPSGTTSIQASNTTNLYGLAGGSVLNFTLYATDTNNNVKQNSTLLTISDALPPVINGTLNASKLNSVYQIFMGDLINATFNLTDETALAYANITWNFSSNNLKINFTGLSGTSAQINNATKIPCGAGCVINVTGYATDSSGNTKQNSTLITIQNIAPTQSTPIITSNDDSSRKNGTLTCNNQSTNDLDNDLVANFIKWFNNSRLISESVNSATLNVGNYSKNDNITCEITPFDGSINGTAGNSTNFTILNAAPVFNNSILNQSWNQDTSASFSISSNFFDIDGDNLTYNFTPAGNIIISADNFTKIVTLTPSSGFSGTRNAVFFAYDGTNTTSSNSVTLTVNAVSPPSSGSSGGGGGSSSGGGGGSGNYICELNWKCDDWSGCADGKQSRKCVLIQVPVFTLNDKCPQNTIPEQSRDCLTPVVKKETCDDRIKNQNEEGIDCGGVCKPCSVQEPKKEEPKPAGNAITGAAVANPKGFDYNNLWIALAVVLAASSLLLYAKYGHRRIFRKEQLSEEEMKKLNDELSYEMFKK